MKIGRFLWINHIMLSFDCVEQLNDTQLTKAVENAESPLDDH